MTSDSTLTVVTTQAAADALNVSHAYLLSLLSEGVIPYQKSETGPLVWFEPLMSYKMAEDAKRMEALRKLTRQAQALDFGY